MKINELIEVLNQKSETYSIGKLQEIRKDLKEGSRGRTLFTRDRAKRKDLQYAFHYGGRKELQFNIGFDNIDGIDVFRYGVAFSVKRDKSFHDPEEVLIPKIGRFNEYLRSKKDFRKNFSMYVSDYGGSSREIFKTSKEIPERLQVIDKFIFLGKWKVKKEAIFDDDFIDEILTTFDKLLPLYRFVESAKYTKVIDKKMARICWNTNGWTIPSGFEGKSKNKGSFEQKHGYGFEEWMFNVARTLNGYVYANIQALPEDRKSPQGRVFDLTLFSINGNSGERYKVGTIKNVEIIDEQESKKVFKEYCRVGWFDEMIAELQAVGLDPSVIEGYKVRKTGKFFNIRYRAEDIDILSDLVLLKRGSIRALYYGRLYKDSLANAGAIVKIDEAFEAASDNKKQGRAHTRNMGGGKKHVLPIHDSMQNKIAEYLKSCRTIKEVKRESKGVDILVKREKDSKYVFIEVKTDLCVKASIRAALSQVMEYAYYDPEYAYRDGKVDKLIIISRAPINNNAEEYLDVLRKDFKIPIYYCQYESGKEKMLENIAGLCIN